MHKKRTRRQQIAIRSFTYGAMTLAAVFGVLLSLAWAMGFRFDFNGGKLTQVALLQFDSFPNGATVKINGETLSSKTTTRENVQSGENTVEITKTGYRSWQKTVTLDPSEVRWLDYIRLIPNSITTDQIKSFSTVSEMLESPNQHWILLRTSDNERTNNAYVLTLADISDPKNVRFSDITISANDITAPTSGQTEKFSIVEWDMGSRYILLKHQVGDTSEYLRIDRENPTMTSNLTKTFGLDISSPHFSGTSGQIFFALTGSDLRKFDASNQTASAPLATGVQSYQLTENNMISFVATETKDGKTTQTVGIYNDGQVKTIKTYDTVATTYAGVTRYRDQDYLAVARGETVAIYPSPLDENHVSGAIYLNSPGGVDWLDFSPSGRFIVAGYQNKLVDFDLDTDDNYSFELGEVNGAPQWVDDTHIVDMSGGTIKLVEFDGANSEDIVSGSGRVTLSGDEKYLFSFDITDKNTMLQRSKLYID